LGELLSSTDPYDAKLANGNYQVIVKRSRHVDPEVQGEVRSGGEIERA
jgi:hypothetical protein